MNTPPPSNQPGGSGSSRERDAFRSRDRSLLRTGYVIAAALMLVPLIDPIATTWPVRFTDVRWRFGTAGLAFNTLVTPLLGVFVAMVLGALLEHRRFVRVLSLLAWLVALTTIVAIVVFSLDYLQLRSGVVRDALRQYDLAARKAIIVAFIAALTSGALGWGGWKASKGSFAKGRQPPLMRAKADAGT